MIKQATVNQQMTAEMVHFFESLTVEQVEWAKSVNTRPSHEQNVICLAWNNRDSILQVQEGIPMEFSPIYAGTLDEDTIKFGGGAPFPPPPAGFGIDGPFLTHQLTHDLTTPTPGCQHCESEEPVVEDEPEITKVCDLCGTELNNFHHRALMVIAKNPACVVFNEGRWQRIPTNMKAADAFELTGRVCAHCGLEENTANHVESWKPEPWVCGVFCLGDYHDNRKAFRVISEGAPKAIRTNVGQLDGDYFFSAYCLTCARPIAEVGAECLHGLATAPEPFTGGLDLTPQQLHEMYPDFYPAPTLEPEPAAPQQAIGPDAGETLPKIFNDEIRWRVFWQHKAGAGIAELATAWGRTKISVKKIIASREAAGHDTMCGKCKRVFEYTHPEICDNCGNGEFQDWFPGGAAILSD